MCNGLIFYDTEGNAYSEQEVCEAVKQVVNLEKENAELREELDNVKKKKNL